MISYYIIHGVIAAGVSASVAALNGYALAGAIFYIGREHAQWEIKGYWDWPGLLVPVALCLAVQARIWWSRGLLAPWVRCRIRRAARAQAEM